MNNTISRELSIENKMKTTGILVLFFLLTLYANGQELPPVQLQDTSIINPGILDPEYFTSAFSLSLPLLLRIIPESNPYQFGRPSLLSLQYSSQKLQQNLDLSSIWKREISKQEEYKTLRMVMGSIQAGGAAYLAYLHFKKYGFK